MEWSGAGILQWYFLEPSADAIVAAREKGVFHPKAGIGILEKEHFKTTDGDVFINYYFQDDPKTYLVT